LHPNKSENLPLTISELCIGTTIERLRWPARDSCNKKGTYILELRGLHAFAPEGRYDRIESLPECLDQLGVVEDRENGRISRCLSIQDVLDGYAWGETTRADPLNPIAEEVDARLSGSSGSRDGRAC
jgi:hypothetical protein